MHLYNCHAIFILYACMQGTDLLKHGRLGKLKMHFFPHIPRSMCMHAGD